MSVDQVAELLDEKARGDARTRHELTRIDAALEDALDPLARTPVERLEIRRRLALLGSIEHAKHELDGCRRALDEPDMGSNDRYDGFVERPRRFESAGNL